jgi:formate dehydrogenase assembly factor FdhD
MSMSTGNVVKLKAQVGKSHDQASLSSDRRRLASLFKMMDVSRHKSVDTLRGYVHDADAFRDHAGAGLL